MTVFSGSRVARSPEGMHDLFQAVRSCHKLFCPPLFSIILFMPCPSPSPTSLYCSPPRTLSSPVSLSLNYSLSYLPLFSSSCSLWWFFFYFFPPFVEQGKLSPRHSINPSLIWLATVLKRDENWALLTTSSLPAFIYLCFLIFYLFPSLPPVFSSGSLLYLVLSWSAVIFWAACFAHLPIPHQHSLKIKFRD